MTLDSWTVVAVVVSCCLAMLPMAPCKLSAEYVCVGS